MARTFTPIDGAAIMTALARQATGQTTLAKVDASNYVSVGETVLATGTENVYNALSMVIGRTLVATRPYEAKLKNFQAENTGLFTSRLRKISYYSKDPVNTGFFNTDLYTNLANGFTNGQNPDGSGDSQSVKSMWEQKQGMPVEVNFGGSFAWDYGITMYEDQFANAFRSPEEMSRFVSGILTEHANDIESGKEAFNRLSLLTFLGERYILGYGVNLTAAFNAKFGTAYTSLELRTTYLKEFLAFMIVTVNQISRFMTERSTKWHDPMTKTVDSVSYSVLRHTPRSEQKVYMYEPLFEEAKAYVLPEIFHEGLLQMDNYEGVDFWQSNYTDAVRPQISVEVPTRVSGVQTGKQEATIPYVVGCIFDKDALMTNFQLERAYTTPLEARKGYRNTWLHIAKGIINDRSENGVILYMADPAPAP